MGDSKVLNKYINKVWKVVDQITVLSKELTDKRFAEKVIPFWPSERGLKQKIYFRLNSNRTCECTLGQ